ncbi:MAG TPA: glycine betaine ABC transporter substrate-binding protein [Candidatus Polarisedimenticolia bacterium]|jgi:osmoprotectant transport system substrate-binding protein|nr:glycine betaine ABC transporter substrate-binding protein [Candidatus Polarisedimenticolia bacterium]
MDRRSFLSALALLLSGCMQKSSALAVGSKNFTEQLVLGELLAQYLGRFTPLPIDKRFYLAGSYICHQALLAGRIDMYVEYTGTALVAILKEKPASDHAAVFNTVKELYSRRFGLEVFPSLGFDNTFAMVMRGSDARRLRLKTLSDAAAVSSRLRLGVGYEFLERPDGYKGLASKYGFKFAEAPRVMDLGLLYRALQNNQVDIVAGSNTDGLIAALDLVVLEDDQHYFPPYDAVPIVRRATIDRHPEIAAALKRLSGHITAEDMRRMNYAVDGEKKDAAAVVKDFLARNTSLSQPAKP